MAPTVVYSFILQDLSRPNENNICKWMEGRNAAERQAIKFHLIINARKMFCLAAGSQKMIGGTEKKLAAAAYTVQCRVCMCDKCRKRRTGWLNGTAVERVCVPRHKFPFQNEIKIGNNIYLNTEYKP
jgi:hypothetical protein